MVELLTVHASSARACTLHMLTYQLKHSLNIFKPIMIIFGHFNCAFYLLILNPITCGMEFGDNLRGGVLKTRQRKQAPCPPKTRKWGCIIYEYQEHIPSDHLKKKLGLRTPWLNFDRPCKIGF